MCLDLSCYDPKTGQYTGGVQVNVSIPRIAEARGFRNFVDLDFELFDQKRTSDFSVRVHLSKESWAQFKGAVEATFEAVEYLDDQANDAGVDISEAFSKGEESEAKKESSSE